MTKFILLFNLHFQQLGIRRDAFDGIEASTDVHPSDVEMQNKCIVQWGFIPVPLVILLAGWLFIDYACVILSNTFFFLADADNTEGRAAVDADPVLNVVAGQSDISERFMIMLLLSSAWYLTWNFLIDNHHVLLSHFFGCLFPLTFCILLCILILCTNIDIWVDM